MTSSHSRPEWFVPEWSLGEPELPGSCGAQSGRSSRRVRSTARLVELDELYPLGVRGDVTDILAVGGLGTWIDRGAGLERTEITIAEPRLRALGTRLVGIGGRHVDEATPFADVDLLGDGVRVHVALAPVSTAGTALSIRLPRPERLGLADLDARGFFTRVGLDVVDRLLVARANLLISGATGSGKTTLLGALLAGAPEDERVITIEDVAELRIDHPHVVGLQARQANADGAGAIDLGRLVRESLRMRPDRIVVGECRGPEIRDLMIALNTGHRGGAGTIHANGVEDVPARLEALGALGGLDATALARQAVSAFDAVLHVARDGPRRMLDAVGVFTVGEDGRLGMSVDDVVGRYGT